MCACWLWYSRLSNETGFFTAILYFRYGHAGLWELLLEQNEVCELSYLLSFEFLQQSVNVHALHHCSHFPHFHTVVLDQILKIRGSFPLVDWIKMEDLCSPGTLTILCPQGDLHHLSCSSFWLAWHFLSLSCSMVGASWSVFLRGVEGAAAEDHAGSEHAELSFICISTYADSHTDFSTHGFQRKMSNSCNIQILGTKNN